MSEKIKKKFIEKHKPLTRKEVVQRIKERKEMKSKLTQDAAVLEKNLIAFNKILDPLVDPENDKVLCWIRRPTQDEWEEMLPAELLEYRGKSTEEIPAEIWNRYKDLQFEMMEKLIEKPKHKAAWWKSHSNLVFQQLFNLHLTSVFELLGVSAENF